MAGHKLSLKSPTEHLLTALQLFTKKKLIPVHSGVILVHSGVIPVHSGPFQCHSGSFRSIPPHSGSFRSVLVFSNARRQELSDRFHIPVVNFLVFVHPDFEASVIADFL